MRETIHTVCKKMYPGSFKNVTYKMFTNGPGDRVQSQAD